MKNSNSLLACRQIVDDPLPGRNGERRWRGSKRVGMCEEGTREGM